LYNKRINTERLEKNERNTFPKSCCFRHSTKIVVSDNSTKIKTTFNPSIKLNKNRKYEMASVSLDTYHSFSNIDNLFRYSPGFVEMRGNDDSSLQQRQ